MYRRVNAKTHLMSKYDALFNERIEALEAKVGGGSNNGGGSGSGGGMFVVDVLYDENNDWTIYTDKTFAEIKAAYDNGKWPVLREDNVVFYMVTAPYFDESEDYGQVEFSRSRGSESGDFNAATYKIDSNNVLTYVNLHAKYTDIHTDTGTAGQPSSSLPK